MMNDILSGNLIWKDKRRLTLAVSIILISILAMVFFSRASDQSQQLEAAMMETTLTQLEQALLWKTLEKSLQHKERDLQNFVNMNPFEWLEQQSLNYSGKWGSRSAQNQAGRWFYDEQGQSVVYKVIHIDALDNSYDPSDELRFRVALDYIDRNDSGVFEEQVDRLVGLKLVSEQTYHWHVLPWGAQSPAREK